MKTPRSSFPASHCFAVIAALLLALFSFKNTFFLMAGRTPSKPPAWVLFFFTVMLWAVLVRIPSIYAGRLRIYANVITRLAVLAGFVNTATEAVYFSVYRRIINVPSGTHVTTADLQSLGQTLIYLPALAIGGCVLAMIFHYKKNPLADSTRPVFNLCTDKKTRRRARIPFADMFRHLLVLGPTGCGKTSLFLIPLAHQLVQNSNTCLLVMDPKGDFARYTSAMSRYYGRSGVLFDPIRPDCPVFNPLAGRENDVVENMVTALEILAEEKVRYFQDQNARLLRNGIRLLKRLYGDEASLLMLSDLLHDRDGFGRKCIAELSSQSAAAGPIAAGAGPCPDTLVSPDLLRQNREIISYFRDHYFSSRTKIFEHTSGVRSQIAILTDNEHLRRVFNPPPGTGTGLNFDRLLQDGGVVCISLAQGQLRGLARYLGLFLQMSFQSAVFRRPDSANRLPAYEIIDEVQVIANEQFTEMVQQARSLGCAVIAATQGLSQLALHLGGKGQAFLSALQTNFQNRVIFAGLSPEDARLFSDWSGLKQEQKVTRGISTGAFDFWSGTGRRSPVKSKSVTEQEKPALTMDEVIYLKAREVIYFTSQHMQLQRPRIGIASWLPDRLHRRFQKLAEEPPLTSAAPVTLIMTQDKTPTCDSIQNFDENPTETDELLS